MCVSRAVYILCHFVPFAAVCASEPQCSIAHHGPHACFWFTWLTISLMGVITDIRVSPVGSVLRPAQVRARVAARVSSWVQYARVSSWFQYVSTDKGGIRTWLALGSVCIAVPAWVWNSKTMSEFLQHATAVNSSTHLTMKAATDWAEVTASFAGLGATVALDSRLASPNLAAAYKFLEDHPLDS